MARFEPVEELFKERHFDQEIVVLCVRWYLSFKLSFRNLVAMIGERGILGLGGHPKPAIRVTRSPGTRSNHAQLFQRGDRLLDPVRARASSWSSPDHRIRERFALGAESCGSE